MPERARRHGKRTALVLLAAIATAAAGGAAIPWQDGGAEPVPFSHRHHVGELGIDCRHCHHTVEESASAGIPPMHTCMSCHYPVAAPPPFVQPIRWTRTVALPDHAYFDHSIHVGRGVGCSTCHGRVDRMDRIEQPIAFTMRFCLDCHRDPAPYLRPGAQITALEWEPALEQRELGGQVMDRLAIRPMELTHCYVCHR